MSICPSDRNDVVVVAARGAHHKHHHVTPQPEGLQAEFAVRGAPIFAGDSVPVEHDADTDEVDTVNLQIAKALGFVIGEHEFIADSIKFEGKRIGERFSGRLSFGRSPFGCEPISGLKTAKALGITVPKSLLQRADEVIR